MTNHRPYAGRGVDPDPLIATLDDVKLFDESSLVGIENWDAATAERASRRLGEVAGRAFGEAMGRELAAVLVPLFAGTNDLKASVPEWTDEHQLTSGERYAADASIPEGDRDDAHESNDETSDSGDDGDTDNGTTEDDTDMSTDTTGGDDSTTDPDDGRDAWGRRKVGLDWPLPPESRLPMESDSARP